jgi:hypothetical protein
MKSGMYEGNDRDVSVMSKWISELTPYVTYRNVS